jgi:hypothetical protein
VEKSPPRHSGRAFGPSMRPFTRLLLRAYGPWVRIAPPLLSGLRQTLPLRAAPSTPSATLEPFSHALHGVELARNAGRRLGAARLLFTARACRRCPQGGWLRRTRSAGQNHRPARRTFPSCTHRAGLFAFRTRPALPRHFPRCRACSHWTSSPDGATIASPTHRGAPMGGTHHVIVGRARSRGLPSWNRPLSLPATFDRNLGYFPTRACTRPASRAGEAQVVRRMSPSSKRGPG